MPPPALLLPLLPAGRPSPPPFLPQEKDEFVENIIADIGRLGLRYERITYTSDYFPQLKECGERLIRAGGCGRRVRCSAGAGTGAAAVCGLGEMCWGW